MIRLGLLGLQLLFLANLTLSNQSLLTILSNGTNPPKVCEFIGDCFDGLKSIIFDPCPPSEIPKSSNALISKDGEIVPFT